MRAEGVHFSYPWVYSRGKVPERHCSCFLFFLRTKEPALREALRHPASGVALSGCTRLGPPLLGALVVACTPAGATVDHIVFLDLDESHRATVIATTEASDPACTLRWRIGAGVEREASLGVASSGVRSTILMGAPGGVAVSARLSCADGEGAEASITTEAAPSSVPTLIPSSSPDEAVSDLLLLTAGITLPHLGTVVLTDMEGQPVWWSERVGAMISHPRFDAEAGVVFGIETPEGEAPARFVCSPLAGPDQTWEVPGATHDSVALGGGRYLLTVRERQTIEGDLIAGDSLVILDAASGEQTVVWSAFDQLERVENAGWQFRNADGSADWTHINGLGLDAGNHTLYASLYWEESIIEIELANWQTGWTLGGVRSDFEVPDGFGPQHSPQAFGGALWLFDNGKDSGAGSRISRYEVDLSTGGADRSFSYQPANRPQSPVLGSVDLRDDLILSSWGTAGEVHLTDSAGQDLASYTIDGMDVLGLTTLVDR